MTAGTEVSQRKGSAPAASRPQQEQHSREQLSYQATGVGARCFPSTPLLRSAGAKDPYVELNLGVAVAAVDAELLEVTEDIEQLPLALVHEDAAVELDQLRLPPQREVDVADWWAEEG